jgi:hypothetical protein
MTPAKRHSVTQADIAATIASFPNDVRNDKGMRDLYLATVVIKHYLGMDWFMTNFAGQSAPGYFRFAFQAADMEREKKWQRFLDLAETLVNLQHIDGFWDCVERMQERRDAEAAHTELDFGKFLYVRDVTFRFVMPQGVRGRDYDFQINYPDGRSACADAKCKVESAKIDPETIKNALESARKKNLPEDEPGIVLIRVPQAWIEDIDLRERIGAVVLDKMRQTERIVAVTVFSNVVSLHHETRTINCEHRHIEFVSYHHRFDREKEWALFQDFRYRQEWGGMPPKWIHLFKEAAA